VHEQAERIMSLRERYGLFDLVINTTQLVYPNSRYDVPGCNDVLPGADYLEPMSQIGDGSFRQLTGGELEFSIGFTEILRAFEQRHFFVVNNNRLLWDDALLPDTDGDGLADAGDFEPNPTMYDHDTDGCSDRVDVEMLPNVGLCEGTCGKEMESSGGDPSTLADIDGDGLPDCAEKVLGYLRTRADSDLDGFPDLIELAAGTNPLEATPFEEDQDGDGVSDGEEIRVGTNPRWPESPDVREFLAYRYEPLYPVPSPVSGANCFEFRVDNVRLAQTLPTEDREAGVNEICVYIVQTPLDDPNSSPTVTKSCKPARYIGTPEWDLKDPPNGVLSFTPLDFTTQDP
ncbi:MAG: thrombospondin type 3 repeat-containing protein, partial [Candidatus Devosia euplotis]|nr:thrombospondin type 3 repeat-containing protein [Candidatus Devosia euplotis]